MTINKVANTDDVQYQSGQRGYGGDLHGSKPDWLRTPTNGGGAVTFGAEGMTVDPGAATDDKAKATGHDGQSSRNMTHVLEFVFGSPQPTPYTDTWKIGWLQNEGLFNSFYFSPTDEQFKFERSNNNNVKTEPAHTIGNRSMVYFRMGWAGNACQFTLTSDGQTSTASISELSVSKPDDIIVSEYNGGGTPMTFPWFRHTYHWD